MNRYSFFIEIILENELFLKRNFLNKISFMGFYLNQLEECLTSSLVTVVQIQNDKINTYAIVKHPINNNYFIIFFDKKSVLHFKA